MYVNPSLGSSLEVGSGSGRNFSLVPVSSGSGGNLQYRFRCTPIMHAHWPVNYIFWPVKMPVNWELLSGPSGDLLFFVLYYSDSVLCCTVLHWAKLRCVVIVLHSIALCYICKQRILCCSLLFFTLDIFLYFLLVQWCLLQYHTSNLNCPIKKITWKCDFSCCCMPMQSPVFEPRVWY